MQVEEPVFSQMAYKKYVIDRVLPSVLFSNLFSGKNC